MLNKEDRLKITCTITLSHEHFLVLRTLYYPLLGNEALALYETLYALAKLPQKVKNHLLLTKLMKCSAAAIEEQRIRLEQFLLLKSYYDGTKNAYLYELLYPQRAQAFLAHEVFGRLYMDKLGKQAFEFMKKSFASGEENKEAYQDISAHMRDMLRDWDDTKEAQFASCKPILPSKPRFFRFDKFLNGLSDMIFPQSERTKENLDFIAEKAELYGIDESEMQKLVGKSMNLKTNSLDRNKLVRCMQSSQKEFNQKLADPYDLPPIRFLQMKQNGIAVSKSDQRLIDQILNEKYHMTPQVINVLIEYVLEHNHQSLARSYVEKVAAAWVRLGIDTKEKAIANSQAKEQADASVKTQRKQLPKWFYEQDVKEAEDKDEAISDEELMERLRKVREQYGKSNV